MKGKIKQLSRMLKIYSAYNRRKVKDNPLPIRLWIELTNVCNLNCVMCLSKSIPKSERGFMDFNLFKKIIDEAAGFVYDAYLHHRGESLLHPDIFKMIKYAKERKISTRLHTNATLLTEEKSYLLLNSGLDFLSFSFDGYDKETYEGIRRGGPFEKTLANIIEFLKMKQDRKKSSPFTVLTVIDFSSKKKKNLNQEKKKKKEFLSHFNSAPLDALRVRRPHNWGGEYSVNGGSLNRGLLRGFVPCTFLWYALAIFWDGIVVPCPQDFFGKLALGNVNQNSLVELWNSKKEKFLREKMTRNDYKVLSPCNKCDRLWRKNLMGIPLEEAVPFLKDNLLGYRGFGKSFSLFRGRS